MAKINGTLVLVSVDGDVIGGSTSHTLNINVDLPDATTKDSDGWAENIHGLRDWSIDIDALHDPDNPALDDTIIGYIIARTEVDVEFETDGGTTYTGKGKFSTVSKNADMEQPVSYSVTIVGNGELSNAPV